ncbi:hypothetical protein HYH03_007542 [Edaphochlamys debaryana]|uniref:Regulator of telomere elongation helicase 1 homolog n=1 Tax=Edaphochlamys debaryana TaxID=47281 RepID=A0A836C081_9CHLO|nr:hypothetical protein HYH03_007542 [Edaphochlamys debaryana]|eukprot:KAG2494184.1 hypothetical protein HYH03_007542 [Edaphochlamys debaryana]
MSAKFAAGAVGPDGKGQAAGGGAYGSAEDYADDDDFAPPGAAAGSSKRRGDATTAQPIYAGGTDKGCPEDEDTPPPPPRIFFASRTHSQIAQVVRELKRSGYKPSMAILAAKQHYCVNKAVIRTGRVDEECERLHKETAYGCSFRSKATKGGRPPGYSSKVHDIEELAAACRTQKMCAYFTARDMALTAELVFCPYSYLLDPVVRAALGLDVKGAVLIFDEAHNMEDVCREGGSMDLDLDALREVEAAFRAAAELTGKPETYLPLAEALARLNAWLARFEGSAQGMAAAGFEEHEAVWQGGRALAALEEAGLGPTALPALRQAYAQAKAYEEKATFTTEGDAAAEAIPSNVSHPGAGGAALGTVGRLLTVLRLMYSPASQHPGAAAGGPPRPPAPPQPRPPPRGPAMPDTQPQPAGPSTQAAALAGGGGFIPTQGARGGTAAPAGPPAGAPRGPGPLPAPVAPQRDNSGDYRVVVKRWIAHGAKDRRKARSRMRQDDQAPGGGAPGAAVSLGLWCFNPAVAFRDLAGAAHSVVLTSGTLAPLDSFASELGTEFHVRLEAPHVVDMSRQVWAGVVPRGPSGGVLSATFKESATFRFQDEAGEAIVRYCQVIPDGVLLFMPSYGLLDKLTTRWKATGLWSRLEAQKAVVVEGREAGRGFEESMAAYYAAVKSGRGALFMAVCRGKASEGIDFADQHARGVILLGIPFPAIKDTKVRLKKEYNDAGSGPSSGRPPSQRLLSGDAWYSQQAFRALNQAVGRCIRHKYDYGAILLLDERFRGQGRQQQLSRWVRAAVKVHDDFESSVAGVTAFFAGLAADPPRPPAPALPPAGADPAPPVSAPAAEATSDKDKEKDKGGRRRGKDRQQEQQQRANEAVPVKAGAGGKAREGAGGKGAGKGKGGMELQYEEDVVPPPDQQPQLHQQQRGAGQAQASGKGGVSAWAKPQPAELFARFRMGTRGSGQPGAGAASAHGGCGDAPCGAGGGGAGGAGWSGAAAAGVAPGPSHRGPHDSRGAEQAGPGASGPTAWAPDGPGLGPSSGAGAGWGAAGWQPQQRQPHNGGPGHGWPRNGGPGPGTQHATQAYAPHPRDAPALAPRPCANRQSGASEGFGPTDPGVGAAAPSPVQWPAAQQQQQPAAWGEAAPPQTGPSAPAQQWGSWAQQPHVPTTPLGEGSGWPGPSVGGPHAPAGTPGPAWPSGPSPGPQSGAEAAGPGASWHGPSPPGAQPQAPCGTPTPGRRPAWPPHAAPGPWPCAAQQPGPGFTPPPAQQPQQHPEYGNGGNGPQPPPWAPGGPPAGTPPPQRPGWPALGQGQGPEQGQGQGWHSAANPQQRPAEEPRQEPGPQWPQHNAMPPPHHHHHHHHQTQPPRQDAWAPHQPSISGQHQAWLGQRPNGAWAQPCQQPPSGQHTSGGWHQRPPTAGPNSHWRGQGPHASQPQPQSQQGPWPEPSGHRPVDCGPEERPWGAASQWQAPQTHPTQGQGWQGWPQGQGPQPGPSQGPSQHPLPQPPAQGQRQQWQAQGGQQQGGPWHGQGQASTWQAHAPAPSGQPAPQRPPSSWQRGSTCTQAQGQQPPWAQGGHGGNGAWGQPGPEAPSGSGGGTGEGWAAATQPSAAAGPAPGSLQGQGQLPLRQGSSHNTAGPPGTREQPQAPAPQRGWAQGGGGSWAAAPSGDTAPGAAGSSCTGFVGGQGPSACMPPPSARPGGGPRAAAGGAAGAGGALPVRPPVKRLTSDRAREAAAKRQRQQEEQEQKQKQQGPKQSQPAGGKKAGATAAPGGRGTDRTGPDAAGVRTGGPYLESDSDDDFM